MATAATWRILEPGESPVAGARLRAEGGERGLRWALYDAAGRRLAQGSDAVCTPLPAELATWDAEAVTLAQRAAAFAYADQPLYIRWLDLPAGGRSRNHATGQRERGVSVYGARYNPVTDLIEYAGGGLPGAALTYLLTGAPAYLVTGEAAGMGSDGEPVIRAARILARLTPTADGLQVAQP